MVYARGTQAPMDLDWTSDRVSVFDMNRDAIADVSLMDVEESIPDQPSTEMDPADNSRVLPSTVTDSRIPTSPGGPSMEQKEPQNHRATQLSLKTHNTVDEDDDSLDGDASVIVREPRRAPRKSKRSFSERARDYFRSERGAHFRRQPGLMERPEVFLTYAQVIFNASLLLVFLYLLFCMVYTVQRDVSQKVREYEIEYLGEIKACSAAYDANRCGTPLQAPALTEACVTWERCAARDPTVVGRARVTAETFAEILNGFVDVVSWKTMVRKDVLIQLFSLLTLSIVIGATNSTLSFFRNTADSRAGPAIGNASYPSSYYPHYSIQHEWDRDGPRKQIRDRHSQDD
ncbi:hypothetical protein MYAM1_004018 [Malassezia yamatoensis]|uniref:Brl1/Brr6 domain-containing protein n=1 Tax=Malassezia yamatoensis TaxID=253288 RepID=A0AAJ5YXC9_9BASI|nr:hypothetical protein MYAM1_004018 [Malassezia yamatoensis]